MSLHSNGITRNDALRNFPASLKERMVEKVQSNKLTIVVGPTGCGKSTLVPQILLEEFGSPILCTQPRRLAVVAVASHVAKQRNVNLGEEVGYHVGQDRVANIYGSGTGEAEGEAETESEAEDKRTRLLFSTAGILLEELKNNGLEALTKFKVVIIDECHERSPESDLCLTIIKEFMVAHPRCKLRLVLMSATFDHSRYTSYFRGVPGCEYVDTITLQTAESINSFYSNVQTYYLEDISRMLRETLAGDAGGISSYYASYCNAMRNDPDGELKGADNGKSLSQDLLNHIFVLVMFLHQQELSSPDAIFLVFAPTYRHLEQIYNILGNTTAGYFDVSVLHSSIDIEECLRTMNAQQVTENPNPASSTGKKRRIFLASAIADSSVTIPGVTCVIDTCRALEVKWDSDKSYNHARTTWSSQAICDQRRGRTGRTCPGRVFRLVHQGFYNNNFSQWEEPKLESASCRDEVLALLSSQNKVMSNPQILLEKCLDPPPAMTVSKAIQYLKDIGACEEVESSRGRSKIIPTEYGRLISTLPFTVEEAMTIIHGAKHGLLHEALVLMAIKSTRPHPIFHQFGGNETNQVNLSKFHSDVNIKNPRSVAVAHLAAYIFWYTEWNTIRRNEMKHQFVGTIMGSGGGDDRLGLNSQLDRTAHDCNVFQWTLKLDEAHNDWCKDHFINPSSVKAISQYVESALKTIYRSEFEPAWLRCQKPEPIWNRGTISVKKSYGHYSVFSAVYGPQEGNNMANLTLIELQEQSLSQRRDRISNKDMACIHFLTGNCKFGDRCKNVHSYSAPRPPCRFQSSCTNPRCVYAHRNDTCIEVDNDSMVDPIHGIFDGGVIQWFRQNHSSLLVLGEHDFSFCHALKSLSMPPALASTDAKSLSPMASIHDIAGLDVTRCHINNDLMLNAYNTLISRLAWNFPSINQDANDEVNESLLRGFFMSAAEYFRSKPSSTVEFEIGITTQGNEFSRWNVMSSAQNAGFCLEWWDYFECSMFPSYRPRDSNNDPIKVRNPRFYVFRLKNHKTIAESGGNGSFTF